MWGTDLSRYCRTGGLVNPCSRFKACISSPYASGRTHDCSVRIGLSRDVRTASVVGRSAEIPPYRNAFSAKEVATLRTDTLRSVLSIIGVLTAIVIVRILAYVV